MPSTVCTPEPYIMHTCVCLPHTHTSVPIQAPAVPATLDWIMHTSSPHTYSHRHDIVSTYRCIAMPFTSAPLSLHHAHIRASLTALTPIYTHTAPCHAYHTRSRDLGPAWEYMLRPVPCMGLCAATWGMHGTMCCDLGPAHTMHTRHTMHTVTMHKLVTMHIMIMQTMHTRCTRRTQCT
jgi:hypothetical protein